MLHVVNFAMANESPQRACVDMDCVFAWASLLCPRPFRFFSSGGTRGTISSPVTTCSIHGKWLCDSAVYAFHEPQEPVDVEIVFIHGLEFDGSKEAYWKTWLARDGTQDNCWPETWLVEKFPHARILSLSYDANNVQTSTSGRMDPYSLGESLVQQMILVGIGQHNCPVVFVCHSFGGLVAKQIVVTASRNLRVDKEFENFLHNIRAFYFYATPHAGIQVDFSPLNPFTSKGSCMSYLEVFSCEVGRLNFEFEQIKREVYNNEWMCFNVGEMHATSHGEVVVPESSARQVGGRFLPLSVGHFDICKPQSKEDPGYLFLLDCISKVIKVHEDEQRRILDLPNGLVGMDDMKNTICEKLGTISIIGLVGMGGIGKTTISKLVYNSQAKFYDKTCFLQDVRSKVRSKDLASVQKVLLKALCGEEVGNSDCVTTNHLWSIQRCIRGKRVLIVIDDVEDSQTLKGLQVPTFQRSLSRGSRVIVTCRNRQVLENHIGMEELTDVEIMKVDHLNDDQALEVFEYHVFRGIQDEDDEMKDFEHLAEKIAKACCGLPLSLKVIGQHLRKQHGHSIGTRKDIWKEALRKLREAQSFDGGDEDEVLWEKLKISYDDLSNDTKSMFLDFACIFSEISSEFLSKVLSEESIGWIWNSPTGLQNLLARSLIEVGGIGYRGRFFTMHDQLRDMGRRIVKDSSLKRLQVSMKKMTRLWDEEEIESFLEANQGSEIIEGISFRNCERLATLEDGRLMHKMTIQRLDRLRLLDLIERKIEVVEYFLRRCGKKLSWLCLDKVFRMDMPHAIEAIGFCTGLRVLQMRDCYDMEQLPTAIGNLVYLLELDLSDCGLRSLPCEIGHLKQLKRLELYCCEELKEIPSSVSQLTNLEYLGLSECSELKSMVEFETQMDHLYELDLSFCSNLRIPFKSLGKLHQLRTLNMQECDYLVIENPCESFRQLSRLVKLNLKDCKHLIHGLYLGPITRVTGSEVERLWNQVIESFSVRLQELRLPAILQDGLPTYPKLKVLEVSNIFRLDELPASLGNLTQLKQFTVMEKYSSSLTKLPDSLWNLVKLEVLELLRLKGLMKLPDQLGHLSSLKSLRIEGMRGLKELPTSLSQLSKLECLLLIGNERLKRLPMSLRGLTRLSRMNLHGCDALEVMEASQQVLLQELEQRGCHISLP